MPIEDKPSVWTTETVKSVLTDKVDQLERYLNQTIIQNDRLYRERFDAQALEFREYRASTDAKFAGVNEFRGALDDAQRDLMPRAEAEVRLNALSKDVADIRILVADKSSQGSGVKVGWALAVGVIGVISIVATLILKFVSP